MGAEAYSTVSDPDEAPSRCTSLMLRDPVTEAARPIRVLPRPDASFVTQLIATAEHSPQTRTLRRASSADALAAYQGTARLGRDVGALQARCSI